MAFLEVKNLFKSYYLHGKRIDVLRGVSVGIERGELVSLVGASGAGKSTFLHVVGTLDVPAAGEMLFEGKSVFDKNEMSGLGDLQQQLLAFYRVYHSTLVTLHALLSSLPPDAVMTTPTVVAAK